MKIILISILTCMFSVVGRSANGLADLLGPQAKVIETLEDLARQRDYPAIYRQLGSEYRSVVSEEYFVSTSANLKWTFDKLEYGRLDRQKHFAWMPVRGVVRMAGQRELRFYTVVFFGEEGGEWKMLNFPFLSAPHLPDMGAIPRWMVAANEQYGK